MKKLADETFERRFKSRMAKRPNGCIEWTGTILADGYGTTKVKHRQTKAHRVSYTLHIGPVPAGIFVLHKCDNKRCVNPRHLFLGTIQDNGIDASSKGRLAHGTKHAIAKLTDESVAKMRTAFAAGETFAALGRQYGVTSVAARRAVLRHTWKHVP